MRLLNSICKVIADHNPGVPVHIMNVPQGFLRPCFLVTLATESTNLLNINVYQDEPIYQVVYFHTRNEADQVYSEGLYQMRESLKALFLMPGAFPVIAQDGVTEKQRYAKVSSFTSEVRLSENAVYTKFSSSFTDTARSDPNDGYELIGEVDYGTNLIVDINQEE